MGPFAAAYSLIMQARSRRHIWFFVTTQIGASEAPVSMGFSRQEYWSGLPFPNPGTLTNPGVRTSISRVFRLAGRVFATWAIREALDGQVVKNMPCNTGDMGLILGQGMKIPRSVRKLSPCAETKTCFPNGSSSKESTCKTGDTGYMVQSLGQEVHPDEEMATHSSICTWRLPRTEEPGRQQSMFSHRVKYGWVTGQARIL